MTKYSRILDPHQQVEVSIDSETGETMFLYGTDREVRLDPEQALELLSFLLSYQAAFRQAQKQTAHDESFWFECSDEGNSPEA